MAGALAFGSAIQIQGRGFSARCGVRDWEEEECSRGGGSESSERGPGNRKELLGRRVRGLACDLWLVACPSCRAQLLAPCSLSLLGAASGERGRGGACGAVRRGWRARARLVACGRLGYIGWGMGAEAEARVCWGSGAASRFARCSHVLMISWLANL
jgi:hypothetical protein